MYDKENREWYKEHKICAQCRKSNAAPNKTLCFDCLEKAKEHYYKRRANMTEVEKDKQREYGNARTKERYAEHKKEGICVRCLASATYGLYCYEHFIQYKRRVRERCERLKMETLERGSIPEFRKNNRLCYFCGDPLSATEKTRACEKCRQSFSIKETERRREKIIAEMEKYNSLHGTQYTYEQYIEMLRKKHSAD